MGVDPEVRQRWLERISSNIAAHGHHVTLVEGGETPRFAYTIGLTAQDLPELILAGAPTLEAREVVAALNHAAEASRAGALDGSGIESFEIRPVDRSWSDRLVLGALDVYDRDTVPALQLVPEASLRTIDVPDMAVPWDAEPAPVWRWLVESWDLAVATDSIAMTDLDALAGKPISEAARWEEGYWELFSGPGPDFSEDRVRAIPLATLLGYDTTLEPVTRLAVGEALRRDPPGPWTPWRPEG